MEKPSLLNPPGSVLVSSPKQAQLNIQQLQQRAAAIPPMVRLLLGSFRSVVILNLFDLNLQRGRRVKCHSDKIRSR